MGHLLKNFNPLWFKMAGRCDSPYYWRRVGVLEISRVGLFALCSTRVLRGGSRISLRGVLNARKARAKNLKPRPLFEEPHRFACVFNGCFSYRSKNYAKVSEIKSLLVTIHFGKGFY